MDKRTDITTAAFAYSVSLLRIRISGSPPGAGTKRQSIHTAVLHGIAVFFVRHFLPLFIITLFRMTIFVMRVHLLSCRCFFYLSENVVL